MEQPQSALGIVALIAFAWVISENRRAVPWRSVAAGLAVTIALAALLLKVPQVKGAFTAINAAVDAIAAATHAGTSFVFGYVGGGQVPFESKVPGAEFILAFQALPVVLVMSVLTSLLFYWRILPPIVHGFAWALERRNVHRHDRWHGGHRRHRAGALRHDPRADHSRRRRPHRGRLGAGRAGRDRVRP